jgi:hypothetical protein
MTYCGEALTPDSKRSCGERKFPEPQFRDYLDPLMKVARMSEYLRDAGSQFQVFQKYQLDLLTAKCIRSIIGGMAGDTGSLGSERRRKLIILPSNDADFTQTSPKNLRHCELADEGRAGLLITTN